MSGQPLPKVVYPPSRSTAMFMKAYEAADATVRPGVMTGVAAWMVKPLPQAITLPFATAT
jgi:hypothetical protein